MADSADKVTFEVDAGQLGDALGRLTKAGRQTAGTSAVLEFRPKGLTIEWAGACEELAGTGDGEACVSVPDKVVTGLSYMLSAGTVMLTVAGERLRVGRIGFACQRLDRMPPRLLAAEASPLDVLLLGYREPPDRIAEAGLTDEVARVGERVTKSVERAAEQLEWLGVPSDTVAAWVEAHLREIAEHSE